MVPRSPSHQLDESAGAVAILSEAVRLLPRLPFVVVVFVIVAVLSLPSSALGDVATIVGQGLAVSATYDELGSDASDGNSVGVRLLLVLVASLVAGVAILVGLVLLVVPGIYLIVRLRLVVTAVMIEDSGPLAALGRSFELTRNHPWTVFGVWVVPTLVGLALGAVVVVATGGVSLGGDLDPTAIQSGVRLASAVSALVVGPVVPVADTLLYDRYSPDGSRKRASGGR